MSEVSPFKYSELAKSYETHRPHDDDDEDIIKSDCESDTSEVLSVGSEPSAPSRHRVMPVVINEADHHLHHHREMLAMNRLSSTPSPASSTSYNDSYYHRTPTTAPSPPGCSQPPSSPTASSVRSPASSSATASSPGRISEDLTRYHLMSMEYSSARQQHPVSHEIVFPSAQRATAVLPLHQMSRLSPPGGAAVQQHRLSISKILQHQQNNSPEHHHVNGNNNNLLLHNNHQNNNNNNNLNNNNDNNQQSLKFSIDNILKADFGRRITDPISLKKSSRPPKKIVPRPIDLTKDFLETSSEGSERGSSAETNNTSPTSATATATTTSGSTTAGGNSTTTTTDSSGKQMLWPAWVYCTRYSDRPSSGELLFFVC